MVAAEGGLRIEALNLKPYTLRLKLAPKSLI